MYNLVRNNIKNLAPYSSARDEFKGIADVYLDANENPFDTGLNRYPDPLQMSVKAEISKIKKIAPQNICLGNGSDEIIDLLIRIFCEPRIDSILILPPTYGMYQVSAAIADVAVNSVPLDENFQIKVNETLQFAKENTPKLLFICNPNNPTGNAINEKAIITILKKFEGIVVIDEAYIDFSTHKSAIALLKKYPNLVVMQTFSKAWGLAGIRLGMALASEAIISLMNKVKAPYNINVLTQSAVLKAIRQKKRFQKNVNTLLAQRILLINALEKLTEVKKIYPSEANFLLVKMDKADELYDYLVLNSIIVRSRTKVKGCEGTLRLTIGTEVENARLIRQIHVFYKN